MDGFRIANLIMQTIYLPVHIVFIVKLIKNRRPTPIWKWFILIVCGLWGIIAGRWMENLLHMFWQNDTAYLLTVDFTLISTTLATMSFLFWNLYIAGHEKLITSKWFVYSVKTVALAVCCVIITNPIHRLFYEHLELEGLKTHGKLFGLCVLIVYGMLLAGLIISIVHIIKYEDHKLKRIIVFSMYPILPGATNLIRSLSGIDKLDFNPIVMTLSIICLYEIVFKERYVGVVPESIESVLGQTKTPIVICNLREKTVVYENDAAKKVHDMQVVKMLEIIDDSSTCFEVEFEDRTFRVFSSETETKDEYIVTFTDVTEVVNQQKEIDIQISKQNTMLRSLDEQKRNIESYIEALYSIPDLKDKKSRVDSVEILISQSFEQMESNLLMAETYSPQSEKALKDNLRISQETITSIRKVVAMLKEGR